MVRFTWADRCEEMQKKQVAVKYGLKDRALRLDDETSTESTINFNHAYSWHVAETKMPDLSLARVWHFRRFLHQANISTHAHQTAPQ